MDLLSNNGLYNNAQTSFISLQILNLKKNQLTIDYRLYKSNSKNELGAINQIANFTLFFFNFKIL